MSKILNEYFAEVSSYNCVLSESWVIYSSRYAVALPLCLSLPNCKMILLIIPVKRKQDYCFYLIDNTN